MYGLKNSSQTDVDNETNNVDVCLGYLYADMQSHNYALKQPTIKKTPFWGTYIWGFKPFLAHKARGETYGSYPFLNLF